MSRREVSQSVWMPICSLLVAGSIPASFELHGLVIIVIIIIDSHEASNSPDRQRYFF